VTTQQGGDKKRFRFLFRREKTRGDNMYLFPEISKMGPQEVKAEIMLRVRSLQRLGIWPCTDHSVLNEEVALSKNTQDLPLTFMEETTASKTIINVNARVIDPEPQRLHTLKHLHPHLKHFSPKHKMKRT
jgi:hypothetical protein